ncbi:MAG: putative Ig domain-containing protein [archaeon]|nr:putative Ig domain-containing protein [archaeon]
MSEAYAITRNALVFSVVMVLMAQTGYLGTLNPWYETLDEEYVPAKSTALPSGLTFSAMTCDYEVMSDVQGDNGNNDALDIVGNETYPAVQTASNATSVFIQLRLDGTPTNAQGTSLQSFMWGMEFDTDGNKSTYEHLISFYGSGSDSLKIYNNTATSTVDSPSDSAESVSVELTPASDYWNSSVADSSFGGDDDYLLTMILPWDVLEDHDMDRNGTPSFNWFGTSTSNQNLNGDFACHDGNNDGSPSLSTTASDPVPLDSALRFLFSGGIVSGGSTYYYVNGTQGSPLTFAPTVTPNGATFEVDPPLPSGLTVSSAGVLSGTPTQNVSGASYTLYANSTVDGVAFSATANIILTVATVTFDLVPNIEGEDLILQTPMTNITFSANSTLISDEQVGAVAGGDFHSCALLDNGSVACWGYNPNGELGNGNVTHETTPHLTQTFGTGRTATAVTIGQFHSCALLDNGSVMCWGKNDEGQLGTGSTSTSPTSTPTLVASFGTGRTAVAISAGHKHTCALLDNGSVSCWGNNQYGRLGNGNVTSQYSPVLTASLGSGRTATAIAAGDLGTCAVLDNGSVACWGMNSQYGMIGNGTTGASDFTSIPVQTASLGAGRTAVDIVAGQMYYCALLDDGSVVCWGSGSYGNLGDGTATAQSSPTQTSSLGIAAKKIVAGARHTCAVLINQTVKCWGANSNGAIGDGSTTQRNSPTAVAFGAGVNVTNLGAGAYHTCALIENGSMRCWGKNWYGAIGDGTGWNNGGTSNVRLSPTNVSTSMLFDVGNLIPVTGSSGCSASPSLPSGLSINSSTCTISGTPTALTSNATYTISATIKGLTFETSVWLSVSSFGTLTSAVEGAHLNLGEAMTQISLNYTSHASLSTPPPVSWATHPALPAGMSISGGTISGTPSVYALNQTYTIYANQSGYSTTHELYFSVDTDNPHTVVENVTIDPIGFHPPFWNGTTNWSVSPTLLGNLSIDTSTGEITGSVNGTLANTTYTVTATHNSSATETFLFNLRSLADYDGDGLPNDLPPDYDTNDPPTSGLVADDDDDGDGLPDANETDTGTYVNESDTGTNPLDPDTDDDGICDGPNAVPGVCIAGPDTNTGSPVIATPIVLVNNTAVAEIDPFYIVSGATYSLSPSLPTSLQFDASNGSIWGTPDTVMANTSYTMWANVSGGVSMQWTFYLTVLDDLDGDGLPDILPGDYNGSEDPIRSAPGLEEDLDDDGDGYNDTVETDSGMYLDENNTGTDPRDPDTDDDGICDGPNAVPGICAAGPDTTPFGPTATVVGVNNTATPNVPPYYVGSGLSYQIMPSLPAGLTIDPATGVISGTPTHTIGNTTFTIFANHTNGNSYSWDFTIEVLEDTDGDGDPDTLPIDYDGNADSIRGPPGLTEDLDDDNDGLPDLNETDTGFWNGEGDTGTDPLNPDTDGDGFCDGPASEVYDRLGNLICRGPDPNPHDPTDPLDTDGDMYPDDDPDGEGGLEADDDDDNDGYPDISEDACNSDSKNATSIPEDMDGDSICDGEDLDMDGDGVDNLNETGLPIGTDPENPDTDGDGVCDGPESPVTSNCIAGPDAFPLDPSASKDTDGDGKPDALVPGVNSTTLPPLEEDLDDDNDGWDDLEEIACGTDPQDDTDEPGDIDGDGICDALDTEDNRDDLDGDGWSNVDETICGTDSDDAKSVPMDSDLDGICNALDPPILVYTNPNATRQYNTSDMWILLNESIVLTPFLDGILADTWEINGTLPEGLNFTGQARSSDGSIFGTPSELMNMTTYYITASNSVTGESVSFMLNLSVVEDTDLDGLPDNDPDGPDGIIVGDLDDDNDGWSDEIEVKCQTNPSDQSDTPADLIDENNECLEGDGEISDPSDEPFSYGLCFLPLLLLLLLLLLVLFYRERELLVGPEPEFTNAEPNFESGQGTSSDPFVLKSPKPIKYGESVVSKELITFTNMSPNIKFPISDLGSESNRTRFKMIDDRGSDEGVFEAYGDEEGTSSIRIMFDDTYENTREGGTFQGLLKMGTNSAYVMWEVEVKPDKEYLKELKKQEQEAEKQRKKEEAEAKKKAEADAKAEEEAKAKEEAEA